MADAQRDEGHLLLGMVLPMLIRVSIALATLNGAPHLRQQLDCYLSQDRLPDELVICDDGSTDETLEIVRDFAASAPFEVRIHQNPDGLGVAGNFAKALSLCTGDLVLLSDQDDVWFRQKLSALVDHHAADPHLLYVHDIRAFYPDGRWSDRSFLEAARAHGFERAPLIKGCATAISRPLLEFGLPIYGDRAHDAWFHDLSRRLGSRYVLPQVLQGYRLHPGQASGHYPEHQPSRGRLLRGAVKPSSSFLPVRLARLIDVEEKFAAATRSDVEALEAFGCDVAAARSAVAAEIVALKARLAVIERSGVGSRARAVLHRWPDYRHGGWNSTREVIRDLLFP